MWSLYNSGITRVNCNVTLQLVYQHNQIQKQLFHAYIIIIFIYNIQENFVLGSLLYQLASCLMLKMHEYKVWNFSHLHWQYLPKYMVPLNPTLTLSQEGCWPQSWSLNPQHWEVAWTMIRVSLLEKSQPDFASCSRCSSLTARQAQARENWTKNTRNRMIMYWAHSGNLMFPSLFRDTTTILMWTYRGPSYLQCSNSIQRYNVIYCVNTGHQ